MQSSTVFHFVSSLKVGGAERFVIDLAVVQKKYFKEVAIISFGAEDDFLLEDAQHHGIKVIFATAGTWGLYRQLKSLLPAGGSGILNIHSTFAFRSLCPIFPFLRSRTRVIIYTRHGCAPLESLRWRISHLVARPFVDAATFVSDAGRKVFLDQHHWAPTKLHHISNGVLIPEAQGDSSSLGKVGKVVKIGSVGRMVKLKAQLHLLQALKSLPETQRSGIEVHFFGDGPMRPVLEDYIQNELDSTSVFFHGMVLDREQVYAAMDFLCVCSETEGLSLAIMEAMAREKPVVATNVGDSPLLVRHERTGLLYEYSDIEALQACLSEFIMDGDKRCQYGRNARELMETEFSLEKTHEQYLKCYTDYARR